MLPAHLASVHAFSTDNNQVARKAGLNGSTNATARKAFVDLGVNTADKAKASAKSPIDCRHVELFISDLDDFACTRREVDEDLLYAKHLTKVWEDVFEAHMKADQEEIEEPVPIVEEIPQQYIDLPNLSVLDDQDESFELLPVPEVDFAL